MCLKMIAKVYGSSSIIVCDVTSLLFQACLENTSLLDLILQPAKLSRSAV